MRSYKTRTGAVGVGLFSATGLTPADLRRALELQGRAHMPLARLHSSTHASLAIAAGLCKSIGGALAVKRMGRLSGFVTELPRSEQTFVSIDLIMPYVLVVEPNRQLANTIASYLTNKNFEVLAVSGAQEAIIQADNKRPDIIVLELAIPEHNGIEFLQELRSHSDWLKIPIVVYTHIPREDTGMSEAQWEKYGVVEYLYKSTTDLERLAGAVHASNEST